MLDSVQRGILRRIQCLPNRLATVAVYGLLGIRQLNRSWTFWRYQRHDIDVSSYVNTLTALQYANSQILIALMTLVLTNQLCLSRFAKNNVIGYRDVILKIASKRYNIFQSCSQLTIVTVFGICIKLQVYKFIYSLNPFYKGNMRYIENTV